jgi:Family of unknown function (DUF6459)
MTSSAPQWPEEIDQPRGPGRRPGGPRPALRVVPDPPPGEVPGGPPDTRDRAAARLASLREPTERDLAAARRRARPLVPSPVAVTMDVAMALLEVEAGCRSASQIERICSPELWAGLEHRIERRGGPLPTGRSVISVRCQESWPGLVDTVAVVQRGARALPVAMRLDAASGRWLVTELRWWVSENDTGPSSCRNQLGGW